MEVRAASVGFLQPAGLARTAGALVVDQRPAAGRAGVHRFALMGT
jgi:hypothetical protein